MKSIKKWFRELFWQRCFYCKMKKEYFFYTWEIQAYSHLTPDNDEEYEVCTDCAYHKKP